MKLAITALITEYMQKIQTLKYFNEQNPTGYPLHEVQPKIQTYQQVILDLKDLIR